jgi:hypothetical protein
VIGNFNKSWLEINHVPRWDLWQIPFSYLDEKFLHNPVLLEKAVIQVQFSDNQYLIHMFWICMLDTVGPHLWRSSPTTTNSKHYDHCTCLGDFSNSFQGHLSKFEFLIQIDKNFNQSCNLQFAYHHILKYSQLSFTRTNSCCHSMDHRTAEENSESALCKVKPEVQCDVLSTLGPHSVH